MVWLVVDFLTVEIFLVVVLSLDWLVDGVGLDRKSEKKKMSDKLGMLHGLSCNVRCPKPSVNLFSSLSKYNFLNH